MLLDSPPLQVNIDLTPYDKDKDSLRLIKVDNGHHTILPPWTSLSEHWSGDHLPLRKHLHVVVKVCPIGEHKQNFVA